MSQVRPSVGFIAWLRAADWLYKSPDGVSPVCHGSQAMSLRTIEGSPDIGHRQGTEAPGQTCGNHCSKEQHSLRKLECPPCLPQLFFTVTAHRSVALQSVYHASPPPRHPVRGCEDSPFTEEKLRLREATRRLQASRMAATSCKVVYVRTRCTTWTRNLSARDPFSTCCLSTFQPE